MVCWYNEIDIGDCFKLYSIVSIGCLIVFCKKWNVCII